MGASCFRPWSLAILVAGTQEPFFLDNATRWAVALRDAGGADVGFEFLNAAICVRVPVGLGVSWFEPIGGPETEVIPFGQGG